MIYEGADFGVFAPVELAQNRRSGDFLRKADAARAVDAAGHDGFNQRPQFFIRHSALVFGKAGTVETIGHGLILQITLPALIADRAVERVIDQEHFHHALAGLFDHFRFGVDDHPVAARHRAGGRRLGRAALDLHKAHAAIGRDGKLVVIAKTRDFDAKLLGGL